MPSELSLSFSGNFLKTFKSERPLVKDFSQFVLKIWPGNCPGLLPAKYVAYSIELSVNPAGQLSQAFAELFAANYEEFQRGVCTPTILARYRNASCSKIKWTKRTVTKLNRAPRNPGLSRRCCPNSGRCCYGVPGPARCHRHWFWSVSRPLCFLVGVISSIILKQLIELSREEPADFGRGWQHAASKVLDDHEAAEIAQASHAASVAMLQS